MEVKKSTGPGTEFRAALERVKIIKEWAEKVHVAGGEGYGGVSLEGWQDTLITKRIKYCYPTARKHIGKLFMRTRVMLNMSRARLAADTVRIIQEDRAPLPRGFSITNLSKVIGRIENGTPPSRDRKRGERFETRILRALCNRIVHVGIPAGDLFIPERRLLADCLLQVIKKHGGRIETSATCLLEMLREAAGEESIALPKNHIALAKELIKIEPSLSLVGVKITKEYRRIKGTPMKVITITLGEEKPAENEAASRKRPKKAAIVPPATEKIVEREPAEVVKRPPPIPKSGEDVASTPITIIFDRCRVITHDRVFARYAISRVTGKKM